MIGALFGLCADWWRNWMERRLQRAIHREQRNEALAIAQSQATHYEQSGDHSAAEFWRSVEAEIREGK